MIHFIIAAELPLHICTVACMWWSYQMWSRMGEFSCRISDLTDFGFHTGQLHLFSSYQEQWIIQFPTIMYGIYSTLLKNVYSCCGLYECQYWWCDNIAWKRLQRPQKLLPAVDDTTNIKYTKLWCIFWSLNITLLSQSIISLSLLSKHNLITDR